MSPADVRAIVTGSGRAAGRGAPAARDADLLAYAEEDETWLLPYVDVISLLLAFLILALAMSKVDLHRFQRMSAALNRQSPPPSLDALKEKIDQMIASKGLTGQIKEGHNGGYAAGGKARGGQGTDPSGLAAGPEQ